MKTGMVPLEHIGINMNGKPLKTGDVIDYMIVDAQGGFLEGGFTRKQARDCKRSVESQYAKDSVWSSLFPLRIAKVVVDK